MDEIWKDVVGYEGLYLISNMGNVKSIGLRTYSDHKKLYNKRKIILKQRRPRNGYPSVNLSNNKKKMTYMVHRLVAIAFIPNPDNKPQVNHIHGIKADNRASELEWVTRMENTQHYIKELKQKSDRKKLIKQRYKQIKLQINK